MQVIHLFALLTPNIVGNITRGILSKFGHAIAIEVYLDRTGDRLDVAALFRHRIQTIPPPCHNRASRSKRTAVFWGLYGRDNRSRYDEALIAPHLYLSFFYKK